MEIPIGILAAAGGKATSYESIASAVGNGSSSVITFSSIPSTFQHLQIRGITRTTTNSPEPGTTFWDLTFNSDNSTNYTRHRLAGDGASVIASAETAVTGVRIYSAGSRGTETNRVGAAIVDIHDYASTTKNKTVRAFAGMDPNSSTNDEVTLSSGLWINTAAINSITITIGSGAFATNSVIALYGIKGA